MMNMHPRYIYGTYTRAHLCTSKLILSSSIARLRLAITQQTIVRQGTETMFRNKSVSLRYKRHVTTPALARRQKVSTPPPFNDVR
jgi:hypothetical protein